MANRNIDYFIANKFIKPEIQKAFIKMVNGCIEHNYVLREILSHARANKRTTSQMPLDLLATV